MKRYAICLGLALLVLWPTAARASVVTANLGGGSFPDVTYAGGYGYVAARQGSDPYAKLNVYRWPVSSFSNIVLWRSFPQSGGHAFPRIAPVGGQLFLAARINSTGYLWNLTSGAPKLALGPAYSNFPFGFGGRALGRRRNSTDTVIHWFGNPTSIHKRATSYGISHLTPQRVPVYMDDLFTIEGAFGTRAAYCGDLTVVEGPGTLRGVRGKLKSKPGKEIRLWTYTNTPVPRCATDGTRFAVVTGGPIRVAEFLASDVK